MSSALKVELTQEYIATRIPKMTEYTETEHNGETVRQYPDGSLRRPNGTLVARHPKAAIIIDKDIALDYNQRRWDEEHSKQAQQRDDAQRAVQRALVSQVSGTKTLDGAVEHLAGHLVAELDANGEGSVKEHGVRNYAAAVDWVLDKAGLIKEKETGNTQVNIEQAAFLVPGTREHVAGLLQSLVASDEDGDV